MKVVIVPVPILAASDLIQALTLIIASFGFYSDFFITFGIKIMLKKQLNIGALNVRGLIGADHEEKLMEDATFYNLDIIALSETHIKREVSQQKLKYTNNIDSSTTNYVLYSCNTENNSYHGVGILIKADIQHKFKRITERVCTVDVRLKHNTHSYLCTNTKLIRRKSTDKRRFIQCNRIHREECKRPRHCHNSWGLQRENWLRMERLPAKHGTFWKRSSAKFMFSK